MRQRPDYFLKPFFRITCRVLPLCLLLASAALAVSDDSPDPEIDEQTALEISQQITRFEENLAALESEVGPYDASLIEALMDLGRYYAQLGQHGPAAVVYDRALNITRISNGLFSPEQVPVLNELTDAYKAAGDWQHADDREHLAFYLKTRLHAPGSQAYTDAVIEFAEWKLQLVRENLLNRTVQANMRDIEELQQIHRVALANVDTEDGSTPPAGQDAMTPESRFALLHGKAHAEYQLARYALRNVPAYLGFPVERYISEYVCSDVVSPGGQVSRNCYTVRRENPRYREVELQRQLYRDRIQSAVLSLQDSIEEMNGLLAIDPALVASTPTAQEQVEELRGMYTDVNRAYRRGSMFW